MTRPLVVTPDPATVDRAVAALRGAGWRVTGLELPEDPFDVADLRLVCVGEVAQPEQAEVALLAAARGAGIVVLMGLDDPLDRERFADELRRAAGVPEPASGRPVTSLLDDPVTALLLDRLADGDPIGVAARAAHLSLRTANRRLAVLRTELRVRSTREVVVAHVRRRVVR